MKCSHAVISVKTSSFDLHILRINLHFTIYLHHVPFPLFFFSFWGSDVCKYFELLFQGNRRETRLLGILSFIHSTVWKVLFGKVIFYWWLSFWFLFDLIIEWLPSFVFLDLCYWRGIAANNAVFSGLSLHRNT